MTYDPEVHHRRTIRGMITVNLEHILLRCV